MQSFIIYDAEAGTMSRVHAPDYPKAVVKYAFRGKPGPRPKLTKADTDQLCMDLGLTVIDEASMMEIA